MTSYDYQTAFYELVKALDIKMDYDWEHQDGRVAIDADGETIYLEKTAAPALFAICEANYDPTPTGYAEAK
jgi:hypothetical protein